MSQGVLSGFPTCGLGAGLSWTESPFLLCGGGVSAWVLLLSLCASFDLLVVEGLVQSIGHFVFLFFLKISLLEMVIAFGKIRFQKPDFINQIS